MKRALFFLTLIFMLLACQGFCQETVFSLLKNNLRLADEYFAEGNYQSALILYKNSFRKNPSASAILLKIAQCYYRLKQYDETVSTYDKYYLQQTAEIPTTDIYYYAEALAGTANYSKAVQYYKQFLARKPDDPLVIKKIWRLNNIEFLYEDSLHFAVREMPINTDYGELCPVPYNQGLIFLSNRKEVQVFEKGDALLNAPFYKIYYSKLVTDSTGSDPLRYGDPSLFENEVMSKYHAGPIALYNHGRKMVFTSTSNETGANRTRTLQLRFAEHKKGIWKVTHPFPYNSVDHSISDPTISPDGTVLYFTSDMPGGLGGKDVYKSEYKNGQWTKPLNLGEPVNTAYDEVFPFLYGKTLYFASNGHAGIGGLDIFKAEAIAGGFDEPQNVGYPINTHADEFAMVIDSLASHGYFSSNRKEGGYNDDLYEFDMDLQTYPLEITGLIRYKEHSWNDTLELKPMAHAKLYLIDNFRNTTVQEAFSDGDGNFAIIIPYFSKYRVKVVAPDNEENIVSFEIPKHRIAHSKHDIVIIKDAFKTPEDQDIK
jgi:tetratricopeptide (TPR) repeat protein